MGLAVSGIEESRQAGSNAGLKSIVFAIPAKKTASAWKGARWELAGTDPGCR
jgi:hypothetical protein